MIRDNANSIPGLYFANRHKFTMSVTEREVITASLTSPFKEIGYAKELAAYLQAKKNRL